MLPPLRSPHDTEVLRDALSKCTIDCVASDHAPHLKFHKEADFLEAAAGIPGLETTVPLMLTEVFEKRLSWVEYLRCCCSAPARIVGLSDKGVLSKGYDADIIAVEKGVWKIHETEFYSKAKYSPFDGRQVLARTVMTIVGGEIVYKDGNFLVGSGTAGRVPARRSI